MDQQHIASKELEPTLSPKNYTYSLWTIVEKSLHLCTFHKKKKEGTN